MESFLYVADNIQMLSGGKPVVMGLYADRTILLTGDVVPAVPVDQAGTPAAKEAIKATFGFAEPIAIPSLSLLLALSDIDPGTYSVAVALVMPNGEPYPGIAAQAPITVSEYRTANIVLNFQPFLFGDFGEFKVRVNVKGAESSTSFRIMKQIEGSKLIQ